VRGIFIGTTADGQPLYITSAMRQMSHMHLIGGPRTGKSKFVEWMMRKDIREGHGFCLIDWHGTLYHDILRYGAHLDVGVFNDFRSVILLDPSQPDFITGFNPFLNRGEDITTQVNRRIDATVRPWGGSDTDSLPTFENTARVLYTFMAEAKETLPNAALLMDQEQRALRDHAIRVVSDDRTKDQLRRFQQIKSSSDWDEKVLSIDNRLVRFVGSLAIRRFMGLKEHNIDLLDIMDSGKILLVNLGESEHLDRQAATVLASLLLYEFMDAGMRRVVRARGTGDKPKIYPVYLDEFENYITEDIAGRLDQALRGGMHLVLSQEDLGHFAQNPKLKKSVFSNARLRAVFGGLDYEDACAIGNEMFLPDLNSRQIKKAYYHTIHVYEAHSGFDAPAGFEGWNAESPNAGHVAGNPSFDSSSGFSAASDAATEGKSEAEGDPIVPVWVPIPKQELVSETEWTREEKLSRVAQLLNEQMQQHCFVKLDQERTMPLLVPFVKEYRLSGQSLLDYQREVYKEQGALPALEVDRLLEESRREFLAAASPVGADESPEGEGDSAIPPPQSAIDFRKRTKAKSRGKPSSTGPRRQRRTPGPSIDVPNYTKVVRIVGSHGKAWISDDNLEEICEALDAESVPVPKTWRVRLDRRSETWIRALENYRHLVIQAIRDRFKALDEELP